MSSLGSPNPFFIAGKKAYEVERSLRFNDDDSTYLQRQPSSSTSGSTQKITISFWIKIGNIPSGTNGGTFFGSSGNTHMGQFFNQTLYFDVVSTYWINTTGVFRDPSAWYHVVYAVDTTQSTSTNRQKIYVNGVLQDRGDTVSDPSQNAYVDYFNNSSTTYYIGRRQAGNYFDGYLAEINFLDGYVYDPSYFGQTDAITGQWNPKKYTGSYGTNGFYLNFSDNSSTSALGTDSSGNGNNFTPNNFSVAAGVGNDSVEDTPTNNFATLNPLFLNATETAGTFSEGNLKLVTTGYEYGTALATFSIRYGKYYWEVKQLGGAYAIHGIVRGSTPNADTYISYDPNGKLFGFGYQQNGYIKGTAGTGSTTGGNLASGYATFTTNDIIGFASDIQNGTLAIYKNNTLIYTITGINDDDWIPAISGYTSNGSYSINFGQQAFSYTPPTGYKKLNSANLPNPTIKLPNQHFNTVLYTGNNNTSQNITGVGFSPDWVWVKNRDNVERHHLVDSVRGDNKVLHSDNTDAERTGSHGSGHTQLNLASDGFNLVSNGSNDELNFGTRTYVAWNWNAGDTDGKTYTVTVVSDSGNKYRFDGFGTSAVTLDLAEGGTYIFNYPSAHPFRFSTTSDGTHGGGTEYTTGVTVLSSTSVQIVVAASAPTLYYYCTIHSGMGGAINTNSTLGSSNFDGSIQSTVKVNVTAGFSILTYTGTGSNATIGHGLGVTANAIIVKRRNGTQNWGVYHSSVAPNDILQLDVDNAVYGGSGVFGNALATSSVFSVNAGSGMSNGNGDTYVAYCFSEVAGYSKFGSYTGNGSTDGPFVFTGFRPAFLLWKNSSSVRNWHMIDNTRDTFNPVDLQLYPNLSTNEYAETQGYDFLSNGFKIRESANFANNNGGTYIYLAFAESPFKNARAR